MDKRVYAWVTEQDQRRTIIKATRISRDLPSLREQLVDRQGVSAAAKPDTAGPTMVAASKLAEQNVRVIVMGFPHAALSRYNGFSQCLLIPKADIRL